MKTKLTRKEAQEKIDKFFQKDEFTSEEVRKIKKLAMKYNIKLGKNRKLFCRECYSKLKGKIRLTKEHKTIVCASCGYANKSRL